MRVDRYVTRSRHFVIRMRNRKAKAKSSTVYNQPNQALFLRETDGAQNALQEKTFEEENIKDADGHKD